MTEGIGVGPFWDLLDAITSTASAGRNPKGHDAEERHGAQHEHAVPSEASADAQTLPEHQ